MKEVSYETTMGLYFGLLLNRRPDLGGRGGGGGKGCNSSRLFTFILVPDPKQLLS